MRESSSAAAVSSSLRVRMRALRVAGLRRRVDLDQPERLDLLRLAVFLNLEVLELEIGDRIALPVGDDHVDAHEVDAGAEHRLAWSGGRLAGVLRRRSWRLRGCRDCVGVRRPQPRARPMTQHRTTMTRRVAAKRMRVRCDDNMPLPPRLGLDSPITPF